MSAHDHLMSELIRVKKLLNDYLEEFEPSNHLEVATMMDDLLIAVNNFTNEPEYQ